MFVTPEARKAAAVVTMIAKPTAVATAVPTYVANRMRLSSTSASSPSSLACSLSTLACTDSRKKT
jgi:hypothetical protein